MCSFFSILHVDIWYQVFLSNTNNLLIDLYGNTTPGQSGLGSNGNEFVLHTPPSSITGASLSDAV